MLKDGAGARASVSRISAVLVLLLAAILSACGHDSSRNRYYTLYSPNGEPLSGGPLGRPSCKEAMSGWFDRVDADHDGSIDLGEYLADARRQFAAMDLDKDGFITPAELTAYRAPYAVLPTAEERARFGETGRSRSDSGDPRDDRVDPVMIADVNLRNQVSLADFLTYANRRFAELNVKHDGLLRREEIFATCKSSS
jgi:hypothetical protein